MSQYSGRLRGFNLAISVDIAPSIGIGHLKRCIPIAQEVQDIGAEVEFILGEESIVAHDLLTAAGILGAVEARKNFAPTIVLIDRVHSKVLNNPSLIINDCIEWKNTQAKVVIIDGVGKDSLFYLEPSLDVDLFLAPYANEFNETAAFSKLIGGHKYFPLSKEYQFSGEKKIIEKARKILVTCGGSDPGEITFVILDALNGIIHNDLQVIAILGPCFSDKYKIELFTRFQEYSHSLKWVDSPNSTIEFMKWCDIAVSTSGSTKYELAAMGVPAILISPDELHARSNYPFIELGTADDLGSVRNLSQQYLRNAVESLLGDRIRREQMSAAGRKSIDGLGARRIAHKLRKLNYDEFSV